MLHAWRANQAQGCWVVLRAFVLPWWGDFTDKGWRRLEGCFYTLEQRVRVRPASVTAAAIFTLDLDQRRLRWLEDAQGLRPAQVAAASGPRVACCSLRIRTAHTATDIPREQPLYALNTMASEHTEDEVA